MILFEKNKENSIKANEEIYIEIQEQEVVHKREENLYANYRPSKIQYKIKRDIDQDFYAIIYYKQKLSLLEAKYAILCFYDDEKEVWIEIPFTHQTEEKSIHFNINQDGYYALFLNEYWYSSFTQSLADEYPKWTYIRKAKESVGQQFLNFFGMQIEEIDEWINWILREKFIQTADVHVLDWIYAYGLPNIKASDTSYFFYEKDNSKKMLKLLPTVKEFFYNQNLEGGIIDYDDNRLYTRVNYGPLQVSVQREDQMEEYEIKPIHFHVWNTLDEFGLLLDLKRNFMEKNEDFKERLLDVFRYPANSSKKGIKNGIARELGLIQRTSEKEWENDFYPFIIHNPKGFKIDKKSIKIDYQGIDEEQYEVINEQHIMILPLEEGKAHTVSFIAELEAYELHNKKDEVLNQMIFKENGQATNKLINWVEYINTISPIMWDRFKWDKGFWDVIDKDLSGVGFIPSRWDTDISVWKDYKLSVDRWEDKYLWK